MRLKHAGSWCERRDLNPHGCPPDPKSGASAIPPLSHSAGGSIFGKQQYINIFSLGKPKPQPQQPPASEPGEPPLPCFPEGGTAHCGLSTPPGLRSRQLRGSGDPGRCGGFHRGGHSYIELYVEEGPPECARSAGRRTGG